ncbi:peptidoglycan bridge formation glycyltransferase FemA/FemB family protein [Candidatus Peregrinibacteria bacterium]|jgi:hypothetical protein|nr:peptidoglycan bridge formation glycyltransferase FemA/FemB family protein [Candidatus Peregrinibacteria bacterium]
MRFSITQSLAWEKFQRATGRGVFALGLESGDRAIFLKFGLPFGRAWSLAMGVDFEKFTTGDFEKLLSWAKSEKCVYIRCEGYSKGGVFEGERRGEGSSRKGLACVKKVSKAYLPEYTIKIDLKLSEAEILAQMKRKGRYNIGVAEKNGVKVERYFGKAASEKAIDEFYGILSETGGRDGFGIHKKSYYLEMLQSLGGEAALYLARVEGKIETGGEAPGKAIAGLIVVYGTNEAVYYYGASSNQYRNMMAPYLLQWQAMKDAKAARKSKYDFMGTARPVCGEGPVDSEGVALKEVEFDKKDPLCGVTEFKQKFGGRLYKFESPVDLVLNSFWYSIIKIAKRLRG